jgi:hypothetical protein
VYTPLMPPAPPAPPPEHAVSEAMAQARMTSAATMDEMGFMVRPHANLKEQGERIKARRRAGDGHGHGLTTWYSREVMRKRSG